MFRAVDITQTQSKVLTLQKLLRDWHWESQNSGFVSKRPRSRRKRNIEIQLKVETAEASLNLAIATPLLEGLTEKFNQANRWGREIRCDLVLAKQLVDERLQLGMRLNEVLG
jgi:hypothetical protein